MLLRKHLSTLVLLLWASVFAQNYEWGPLHVAAINNDAIAIATLANTGADLEAREGHDEWTPLHTAAFHNNYAAVQALIDAGADINARDRRFEQAIHLTVNSAIVRLLVESGASASSEGHHRTSILHLVSGRGDAELVKFLIDNGADVHHMQAEGLRAIHFAASSGNPQVIRYLIEAGAEVNEQVDGGMTALHYAAMNSTTLVACELMAAGADVNQPTWSGSLPIDFARTDEMRQLLQTATCTPRQSSTNTPASSHGLASLRSPQWDLPVTPEDAALLSELFSRLDAVQEPCPTYLQEELAAEQALAACGYIPSHYAGDRGRNQADRWLNLMSGLTWLSPWQTNPTFGTVRELSVGAYTYFIAIDDAIAAVYVIRLLD